MLLFIGWILQLKLEKTLDVDKNSTQRYINVDTLPLNKIATKNLRKTLHSCQKFIEPICRALTLLFTTLFRFTSYYSTFHLHVHVIYNIYYVVALTVHEFGKCKLLKVMVIFFGPIFFSGLT